MEKIVSDSEVTWAENINWLCKWLTSFSTLTTTFFLIIFWVWLYYQ